MAGRATEGDHPCASRPRHPYIDKLATRGVLEQIDLDDASSFADDNAATPRAFWEQVAPSLGLDARFVAQAVERAGGNLQHAEMLRRHLSGLSPEQRRVEDIPRGLAASIASAWERVAIEPPVVDGLGLLCAARDALTLDELGRVAGWTLEPQRRDRTEVADRRRVRIGRRPLRHSRDAGRDRERRQGGPGAARGDRLEPRGPVLLQARGRQVHRRRTGRRVPQDARVDQGSPSAVYELSTCGREARGDGRAVARSCGWSEPCTRARHTPTRKL